MSNMFVQLSERPRISEKWLKSVGFKWDQFDRQPDKHWTLWLAGCEGHPEARISFTGPEDFGIELAPRSYSGPNLPDGWFCWFRGDCAGRYHRFIHVRHLQYQDEVIMLVQALTGRMWEPQDHMWGRALCPTCAERWRQEQNRADLRQRERGAKWSAIENDDTRGGAKPEHMQAAIDAGLAK